MLLLLLLLLLLIGAIVILSSLESLEWIGSYINDKFIDKSSPYRGMPLVILVITPDLTNERYIAYLNTPPCTHVHAPLYTCTRPFVYIYTPPCIHVHAPLYTCTRPFVYMYTPPFITIISFYYYSNILNQSKQLAANLQCVLVSTNPTELPGRLIPPEIVNSLLPSLFDSVMVTHSFIFDGPVRELEGLKYVVNKQAVIVLQLYSYNNR